MGTLHNLTLRTATAVGRLAELQRRADRIGDKPSPIAKSALQELSTAVEELQVANEALQTQIEELTAARHKATSAHEALDEFSNVIPLAVLWTDRSGVIEKGNESASQLLNIGRHHLQGKPLMLFVTDRSVLFAAVRSICETPGLASIDVEITGTAERASSAKDDVEWAPRPTRLALRLVSAGPRCRNPGTRIAVRAVSELRAVSSDPGSRTTNPGSRTTNVIRST